jgi:hypothetical protein
MALGRFGIKEVADVRFYDVLSDESAAKAAAAVKSADYVIEFDTLKVSNIESTAESSDARGGKGNAALISWDYGREITVTIEDALMSASCLSLLFEDDANSSTDGTITINANKAIGANEPTKKVNGVLKTSPISEFVKHNITYTIKNNPNNLIIDSL